MNFLWISLSCQFLLKHLCYLRILLHNTLESWRGKDARQERILIDLDSNLRLLNILILPDEFVLSFGSLRVILSELVAFFIWRNILMWYAHLSLLLVEHLVSIKSHLLLCHIFPLTWHEMILRWHTILRVKCMIYLALVVLIRLLAVLVA